MIRQCINKYIILNSLIKDLDENMDKTDEKMGKSMKRLSNLLKTTNSSQIKTFLTLLCVCIVLFLVLLLT